MKNKKLISAILFVLFAGSLFAQRTDKMPKKGKNDILMSIPDLTDSQKDELKKMRTAHLKEIKPLRNEIKEKQAHLETLQTSDNPNMNEIFAEIDKIGKIRTDIAKKNAEFRQKIRKTLTDDQRIYYDMNIGKHHKKMKQNKMQNNH